jgi:ribosomal protection tetracycline resistance protein
MRTLNLGILAHVDAGKTSLTERLLYAAGVISEIGSVDHGNTQTDSLALERQRGITIKSAVVSFVVGNVVVNLIDTPGHPDFIAEVERVLSVLDGAVLVVSAVEGVQAQTRVLMRTLKRLGIPTLLFVNKIDRGGAQPERVVESIVEKLTPAAVAMGSVRDPGARGATFVPYAAGDAAFTAALAPLLAEHDDALLASYVGSEAAVPTRRLRRALVAQSKRALVHPVFFGSAITGAGVDELTAGITELLPAPVGDRDAPVWATVFKVDRGPAGEKVAYARIFSGSVRTRDRLRVGAGRECKVTAIAVFDRGAAVRSDAVEAGRIAKVWGLADVRIGDSISDSDNDSIGGTSHAAAPHHFAPPTLETVVVPRRAGERGALRVALGQLEEQDPLINLRQDDVRQEIFLSLYGEVQKEVIQETLASEFGIDVDFRETTTLCIERPVGAGAAVEVLGKPPNPFLATVGLRVEPGAINSGVEFRRAVEVLGTMPLAFFKAVEDTVRRTLRQGVNGWQVVDCVVTMTHSGYAPRQSHAHQRFNKAMSSTGEDFRGLTPLVVMSALRQAGTTVHEPTHHFHLEFPADTLGTIVPALARVQAVPDTPALHGSSCTLEGEIPAARLYELQQQLPALTRGEGVLESEFAGYQPVRGPFPTRPRTDDNPLDRKEYLLNVGRRRK